MPYFFITKVSVKVLITDLESLLKYTSITKSIQY